MAERADEECDKGRHVSRNMGAGGAIDMPTQKMVDGYVPFAREFQPKIFIEEKSWLVLKHTRYKKTFQIDVIKLTNRTSSTSQNRNGGPRNR